jgi:hypothetical protein
MGMQEQLGMENRRKESLLGSIRKAFVSLLDRKGGRSAEQRTEAEMHIEVLNEIRAQKIREVLRREEEIEFLRMMVINNINLIEEMDFAARLKSHEAAEISMSEYKYYNCGKSSVDDLVGFYSQIKK